MKPRQAAERGLYWLALLAGLMASLGSALTGCTLLRSGTPSDSSIAAPIESASPSPSPTTTTAASPASPEGRPDTRIMPMTIEGEVVELELRLFNQQSVPFTTYVPKKDFKDEVDNSEQGTVTEFVFSPSGKKDESAYVQIFLPARRTSVEEMRNLLLSEQGLLAANNWDLVDRTDIVSYAWAREKLIYRQQSGKQNFVGSIYIGDHDGRSFYALTHYPAEYVDGFEPRSTIVLENLRFRDENS